MSTRTGAIPRYRAFAGPALLSQGYRPFFLGAGLWAALALALWAGALFRGVGLASAFPPSLWHAHAMLFGYLSAALAGFLLTAVPNWTGRMPLQGAGLAALALLWLVGRVATALSAALGPGTAMALDLAFFVALPAVAAREIVAGRNWRNLPIVAALTVLLAANALVHLGPVAGFDPQIGLRLGAGTFAVLIALVGGRVTPSFTRNWLGKRKEQRLPAPTGVGDRLVLAATVLAMLAWTVRPDWTVTAGLAAAAGAGNLWRLARWRGHRTWREPLLLVLHLGYLWLAVALCLLGAAGLTAAVPDTSALHALTAGAMGTMPLAVMTRATLGHTGHALTAGAGTVAIFALAIAAGALRVAAPLAPSLYMPLLAASAAAWIAAFALFFVLYLPLWLRPRR